MDNSMNVSLTKFGDREEIRELADRLKMMMPGGVQYTQSEALTLAQIAIAHDLDPFNGEAWLIKDNESGKVYGALIGIKGFRKHAKRQANYWGWGQNGGFERITDPRKLTEYNVQETSIVYEYHIMDEVTLEAYTHNLTNMVKGGVPLEVAQKIMGPAPITLGVGVWTPGERTKMKPHQCAMFRAEKDALKRRFDVKFRVEIEGQIIPAEFAEEDQELEAERLEAEYETGNGDDEPHSPDEIMEELGYAPPEGQGKLL